MNPHSFPAQTAKIETCDQALRISAANGRLEIVRRLLAYCTVEAKQQALIAAEAPDKDRQFPEIIQVLRGSIALKNRVN
jgi:hypothetical protein